MKKILLLVLLLAAAAGAAAYYCVHVAPGSGRGSEYYAEYLPADALAAVSLLDLQGLNRHFPESGLGKFLAKPVMHDIMRELGADYEELQNYDDLYDGIADLLTDPSFRQVFGDDAAVGMLAPDPERLRTNPRKELQASLIAFGTSAAAESIDSITRLIMGSDAVKETVNGLELTRIRLDDHEFLYGWAKNGIIIIAYSPERIAAALQQHKAGGGLSSQPAFAAAKKFWAESGQDHYYFQSYFSLSRLRSLLASANQEKLRKTADYLQGMQSMSATIAEHQGSLRIAAKTDYDLSALHERVKQQVQRAADKNRSLHLLNESALAYYWFSGLEAKTLAEANPLQYKAADAMARQELGLPLDEVLAAVGPQAGMTLNGIVNTGLFPLPQVVLFGQNRDNRAAEHLFAQLRRRLAKRGFADEQATEMNGQAIYYWPVLQPEAAHIAAALSDTMFYAANGEASLKAVLAQEANQAKLSAAGLDPEFAQQFAAANSSAFVLRPARLAGKIRESSSWLGTILAISGRSAERLQDELLRLMDSIALAAGFGSLKQDHALSVFIFQPAVPQKP